MNFFSALHMHLFTLLWQYVLKYAMSIKQNKLHYNLRTALNLKSWVDKIYQSKSTTTTTNTFYQWSSFSDKSAEKKRTFLPTTGSFTVDGSSSRLNLSVSICYLNPGPSVILGCGPGVHKTLLIQPGKVGVPFLEAEESSVSGGGCYLLVGDDSTLHAQWTGTFCSIHRNDTWMERLDLQCTAHHVSWLNLTEYKVLTNMQLLVQACYLHTKSFMFYVKVQFVGSSSTMCTLLI